MKYAALMLYLLCFCTRAEQAREPQTNNAKPAVAQSNQSRAQSGEDVRALLVALDRKAEELQRKTEDHKVGSKSQDTKRGAQ